MAAAEALITCTYQAPTWTILPLGRMGEFNISLNLLRSQKCLCHTCALVASMNAMPLENIVNDDVIMPDMLSACGLYRYPAGPGRVQQVRKRQHVLNQWLPPPCPPSSWQS
jgi:hypothetical protein